MLEVRSGTRPRTERRRIERSAAHSEKDEAHETGADLEAAGLDVLVRQTVARKVQEFAAAQQPAEPERRAA